MISQRLNLKLKSYWKYGGGSQDVLVMILWWDNLFGSSLLADERLVDVRNDTATSDGRLDQAVEFFVSTNSELKMARCDTFYFQILRSVAGQLENLEKSLTVISFETSAGSAFVGRNFYKNKNISRNKTITIEIIKRSLREGMETIGKAKN